MNFHPFSESLSPSTELPDVTGGSQGDLGACSSPASGSPWELCVPHLQPFDETRVKPCEFLRLVRLTGRGFSKYPANQFTFTDWHFDRSLTFLAACTPDVVTNDRSASQLLTKHTVGQVVCLHIYVHERSNRVSQNADPEEGIVLDFGIFRRGLINALGKDGSIDAEDFAVIRAFDEPFNDLSRRTKATKAFNSVMRNGWTRRSQQSAKEAGIAFVFDQDVRPANVVDFTTTPIEPEAA